MYSNLILIVIIGLALADNNTNTTDTQLAQPPDIANTTTVTVLTSLTPALDNSSSPHSSNSSVVEFFGREVANNTAIDENIIENKYNNQNKEKLDSNHNQTTNITNNTKRHRIRAYNQDPLQRNAQQQNPFLSGAPARGPRRPANGNDQQLQQLLQNNPRLRLLAEQNPEIAQQIFRNPRLLRDPRIANAIRAQLGDGGGGLLSFLPGLGGALNPLGLGLGGGGAQRRPGFGGNGSGGNGGNGGNNGLFGAPLGAQRRPFNRNRNNEENIGGGYYGNNGNYGQNNDQNNNNRQNANNEENNENSDTNEGTNEETPEQDYDNSGQGNEEGQGDGQEEGAQEAQDPNQDPANDPDIQQLQNLGGGAGDNFPEGLFPPGLLSKEDLAEIRKQQEKQAKEQAEKEKQQAQGQGGEGQDYDYGNNGENDGSGEEAGEEVTPAEGEEGSEDTTSQPEEEPVSVEPTPTPPPVYKSQIPNSVRNQKYRPEFGGVRQGSVNNAGVQYDEILDDNTPTVTPPLTNSIRSKGRAKLPKVPEPIPVPVQPYLNTQQPISGVFQQPGIPQVYPGQYQQPVQYYPQYQPQYVPQQQFVSQQPGQYPQQYIPQQQYIGQQPNQYLQQQQPIYQPIPVQQPGFSSQQQYNPQQAIYGQYGPQQIRAQQPLYNNPNLKRGVQRLDPLLANHNLNTVPHDDAEDTAEGYEDQNGSTDSPYQLGNGRQNGRSFQQQPRIFSSSAQNTESSLAFNSTEPTVPLNKFNIDNGNNHNDNSPATRTFRLGF